MLDEEVAGLRLDVEWTEGVEERVRELLERSTLKLGEFMAFMTRLRSQPACVSGGASAKPRTWKLGGERPRMDVICHASFSSLSSIICRSVLHVT